MAISTSFSRLITCFNFKTHPSLRFLQPTTWGSHESLLIVPLKLSRRLQYEVKLRSCLVVSCVFSLHIFLLDNTMAARSVQQAGCVLIHGKGLKKDKEGNLRLLERVKYPAQRR